MRRGAVPIAVALLVTVAPTAGARAPGSSYRSAAARVPGEVIVHYRPGTEPAARAAARGRVGGGLVRRLRLPATELIDVGRGRVDSTVAALQGRTEVDFAEPNYVFEPAAQIPNDPLFNSLWGLHNTGQTGKAGSAGADIAAPEAWAVTTGSRLVVVAAVDTGIAYDHPDLEANMVRGWDFVGRDPDPYDHETHGTHVAGTIGATGNNSTGVTGVAWKVSMMPLRALGPKGGTSADVADAFAYAGARGARVVNASLVGPAASRAIKKAIAGAPDTLFVVAAGNSGANNDVSPTYPCNYPAANLICVAATNEHDVLAAFSNYGATGVDLAAPGTDILSTVKNHARKRLGYDYMSGTSMATPHVTGAAALLVGKFPDATVGQVRDALLEGVDERASLAGKVASGGRLNVARALDVLASMNRLSLGGFSSPFVNRAAFTATISASDPDAVESFDLRHREAPYNGGFALPETQTSSDGEFAIRMKAGRTRCFRARVEMTAAFGAEKCTATPVNNVTLTHRDGWTKKRGPGRYLNSFSTARKRGASLVLRGVNAKRLALVATKCNGCGTVDVFLGTTRLKRVNLSAPNTKRKQIVPVASFGSVVSGTVKVVVATSGRTVIVEGLGASRT